MTDFTYETELHEACVQAAKAIGCRPMTNVVVLHRGRPTGLGTGSPDLIVVIPGSNFPDREPRYVWFELKRPTMKGDKKSDRSKEQVEWHEDAKRFGMRVHTIRAVTEMVDVITAVRFGRAA